MITIKEISVCNNLLGNKWNLLIIKSLLENEKRFSAIKKDIHEISDRILSEKIKNLIDLEIIETGVVNFNKTYKLTEKGKALQNFIEIYDKWITDYY